MPETRVFKPGKQSLVLTIVVVGILLLLSVGVTLTPDPQGPGPIFGMLSATVAVLVGALLVYVRISTRLVLDDEGLVCTRTGKELRLEWGEISDVRGTVVTGRRSDREYVALVVPRLDAFISRDPQLSRFKSQVPNEVWLTTSLYDEGAGEIVEQIRRRLSQPEQVVTVTPLPQTRTRRTLPTRPAITFRAWYAGGGIAMFGSFFAFGIYMGASHYNQIPGVILSSIFVLVFGPLTAMGVSIAATERVSMQPEFLEVNYPGLTMRTSWQEIVGVGTVGRSSAQVLIVKLGDFAAFRDSLPSKERARMINMLAGRGEGIPIKRDMMPVSLSRLAAEIGERAGI